MAHLRAILFTSLKNDGRVSRRAAPGALINMEQATKTLIVCLLGILGSGCSASQEEIFSETQLALAEGTGETCSGNRLGTGEIEIDDRSDQCGASQYCLSVGEGVEASPPSEGVCSCRCDGPEGSGPFCACLEGFTCTHLIEDLGIGNASFAGSYCIALED